jgi:hypothetical protein
MNAWNVYLNNRLVNTIYFDKDMTAEDVRSSLVNHDGYSINIRVSL